MTLEDLRNIKIGDSFVYYNTEYVFTEGKFPGSNYNYMCCEKYNQHNIIFIAANFREGLFSVGFSDSIFHKIKDMNKHWSQLLQEFHLISKKTPEEVLKDSIKSAEDNLKKLQNDLEELRKTSLQSKISAIEVGKIYKIDGDICLVIYVGEFVTYMYKDATKCCRNTKSIKSIEEPDQELSKKFQEYFEKFQKLS
jgi:DNA replicative helicase MCM subunit Mcm2 (Cdc46/Mcm family)